MWLGLMIEEVGLMFPLANVQALEMYLECSSSHSIPCCPIGFSFCSPAVYWSAHKQGTSCSLLPHSGALEGRVYSREVEREALVGAAR